MEILIPIVTLFIGGVVTFIFSRIQTNLEVKRKFKEEHYCALLENLQSFVGSTATADAKRRFFNEYYRSWVYADEDVILSIKKLIDSRRVDLGMADKAVDGKKLLGDIVLSIRKDLGQRSNLPYDTFEYIDVIETNGEPQ